MDQADDPLQRGVCNRPCHADQGAAAAVDRAREDETPQGLGDRLALTGQRRLVGPSLPLHDLAVDGEALAGSDSDQVADVQRFDLDAGLNAVADEASLPRPEPDEGIDRPGGPVHGIRFEGVAQ